jgi:hypothetical protein
MGPICNGNGNRGLMAPMIQEAVQPAGSANCGGVAGQHSGNGTALTQETPESYFTQGKELP